ncbi:hypothetical protein EL22_21035 [Halostagnicola sp. A56]|uniref:hypothetical protein n=1 Tax=Halostagnicola sp. A56 TaxID=1495067 RepID=UPI00049EAB55|nr:hypothetical protein [Halostagnicola sp. A56]KDE60507.1 hypothetical protein EL22_21035 [Halostagnicola sp. A56]
MNRRAVLAGSVAISLAGCLNRGGGRGNRGSDRIRETGDIELLIDGSEFDLSQDKFQSENVDDESLSFHLHEGDDKWYMEGESRVTIAEGLDLLPAFEYTQEDGTRRLTIDGTTYDESEAGTEISSFVDGEEVDPAEYTLADGDDLRIEITTDGS